MLRMHSKAKLKVRHATERDIDFMESELKIMNLERELKNVLLHRKYAGLQLEEDRYRFFLNNFNMKTATTAEKTYYSKEIKNYKNKIAKLEEEYKNMQMSFGSPKRISESKVDHSSSNTLENLQQSSDVSTLIPVDLGQVQRITTDKKLLQKAKTPQVAAKKVLAKPVKLPVEEKRVENADSRKFLQRGSGKLACYANKFAPKSAKPTEKKDYFSPSELNERYVKGLRK